MALPNLTDKYRGVIVGSMGTTTHLRTWVPVQLSTKSCLVGIIHKNNYEGVMLSGMKRDNKEEEIDVGHGYKVNHLSQLEIRNATVSDCPGNCSKMWPHR
ncbi:hypothetical protein TNCV_4015552 [Trichonephila clavipes]|nr:hypothetical protein TNCV_4015552 [Trichonephila clavipes]